MDTWRSNTIFTIQTIASPAARAEFASETGLGSEAAGELICMWGDDMYQPDLLQFVRSFSEAEIAAMRKFHTVFSTHFENYQDTDAWAEIAGAAASLLEEAGWHERATYNAAP